MKRNLKDTEIAPPGTDSTSSTIDRVTYGPNGQATVYSDGQTSFYKPGFTEYRWVGKDVIYTPESTTVYTPSQTVIYTAGRDEIRQPGYQAIYTPTGTNVFKFEANRFKWKTHI